MTHFCIVAYIEMPLRLVTVPQPQALNRLRVDHAHLSFFCFPCREVQLLEVQQQTLM